MLTEGFFAGAFFALAFAAVGFVVAFAMGISCLVYLKVRDYLFLKQGLKYKFRAIVAKRELAWSCVRAGVLCMSPESLETVYKLNSICLLFGYLRESPERGVKQ